MLCFAIWGSLSRRLDTFYFNLEPSALARGFKCKNKRYLISYLDYLILQNNNMFISILPWSERRFYVELFTTAPLYNSERAIENGTTSRG